MQRIAVRAPLAHADAVTPAVSGDDQGGSRARRARLDRTNGQGKHESNHAQALQAKKVRAERVK